MANAAHKIPTHFAPAMNSARRALYRFSALALVDPLAGSWSRLADRPSQECVRAACELLRDEPASWARTLGLGEEPQDQLDPEAVFARLPASPEELNTAYEQTFGLLVTAGCPPYETEYIDGKLSFQRSAELADIAGYYRAFGMDARADPPERPDHISLELEFMAVLIDLECRATTDEQFQISRQAQADFIRDHLSWWVPTFARLLAKENPDSVFAATGHLLCAFLPMERMRLDIPAPRTPVETSLIEPPELADACAACTACV